MGLFDKLNVSGLVDKIKSTGIAEKLNITGTAADSQNNSAFADEESKKYYEIAFGLLSSLNGFIPMTYEGIKRYVEFHLGNSCNEEKLEKVLSYIDKPLGEYKLYTLHRFIKEDGQLYDGSDYFAKWKFSPKLTQELLAFNNLLDSQKTYRCPKHKIVDICYTDILDDIKKAYNSILNICKERNDYTLFQEGINKKFGGFRTEYAEKIDFSAVNMIIDKLIRDSFFEGDEIVKSVLFEKAFEIFSNHKEYRDREVVSMALRALHFEQFGNNKEAYESISYDVCYDYVMNSGSYAKARESHVFDKEEFVTKESKAVYSRNIFGKKFLPNKDDKYYTDAVCHMIWKELCEKYNEYDWEDDKPVSESKDPGCIVFLIYKGYDELYA